MCGARPGAPGEHVAEYVKRRKRFGLFTICGTGQKGYESFSKRSVTYQSTRLLFKADVIEQLGLRDRFRVETPDGTFEMTKAEVYRVVDNVVRSRSYRDKGIYHYPVIPEKANQFRRP